MTKQDTMEVVPKAYKVEFSETGTSPLKKNLPLRNFDCPTRILKLCLAKPLAASSDEVLSAPKTDCKSEISVAALTPFNTSAGKPAL